MSTFRPKEILREARTAEEQGDAKTAAAKYSQVAGVLLKRKSWKEARTLFERALALQSELPRVQLMLAKCSAELNDLPRAERALRDFIQLTVRKGKFEKYRDTFDSVLKDSPALRRPILEALVEIDRTNARLFLGLAECYESLGQWPEAMRAAIDAFKTKTHDEESLPAIERLLAAGSRGEAQAYVRRFAEGKLARADLVTLLEGEAGGGSRITAAPPENDQDKKTLQELIRELEVEIGIVAGEDRDSVEPLVREFRKRADGILSTHTKSRMDIALAFSEMGLMDHAIEELSRIDSADPLYHESQCLLGELYFREGVYMKAIEALQQCLRDGKAGDEIQREAYYKLAEVYMKLGDSPKAKQLLKEVEKRSPDYRQLRRMKSQVG